jgi:hypothetical protein
LQSAEICLNNVSKPALHLPIPANGLITADPNPSPLPKLFGEVVGSRYLYNR